MMGSQKSPADAMLGQKISANVTVCRCVWSAFTRGSGGDGVTKVFTSACGNFLAEFCACVAVSLKQERPYLLDLIKSCLVAVLCLIWPWLYSCCGSALEYCAADCCWLSVMAVSMTDLSWYFLWSLCCVPVIVVLCSSDRCAVFQWLMLREPLSVAFNCEIVVGISVSVGAIFAIMIMFFYDEWTWFH
jgi:hypothetical protein